MSISNVTVIDFIASQGADGASSKAIAKHFGVNSKLINTAYSASTDHVDRFEKSWAGIYKVAGIVTRDHVHYVAASVPTISDSALLTPPPSPVMPVSAPAPASIITENNIIDFITIQGAEGASSKAIAKHFGVNSKLVNTAYSATTDHVDRFEKSWPGIYKVAGIVTRDHVHYAEVKKVTAAVAEKPVVEAVEVAEKPTTVEAVAAPEIKEEVEVEVEEVVNPVVVVNVEVKFDKFDVLFYVLMLVMFVAHIIYKVDFDYPDLHRIGFINAERQLALYLPSVSSLAVF